MIAVDRDRFHLKLSLKDETIKFHILQKLSDGNESYAINEFYKLYRNLILNAIAQTEGIQYFQMSCEGLVFKQIHDAQKLIKSLNAFDEAISERDRHRQS